VQAQYRQRSIGSPLEKSIISPFYSGANNASLRLIEEYLRQMLERPPEARGDLILEYPSRDGGPTLPTIGCGAQMLRSGEKTNARRHTSSGIYHVVRGRGKTVVNNVVLEWKRGDCFVVPNWSWHWHENNSRDEDAFLFFISDRPMLEPFGLYREEYR